MTPILESGGTSTFERGCTKPALLLPVLAAACLALLSGCASVAAQRKELSQQQSCCASPREFVWRPLPLLVDTAEEITVDTPVFRFAGGNSHFIAYELEATPRGKARRLDIASTKQNGVPGFPVHSYFHPEVTLYDADFREVGHAGQEVFFARKGGLLDSTVNVDGTLLITHGSRAKYLVVHTTDETMAMNRISQRQTSLYYLRYVVVISSSTAVYEAAPRGRLLIKSTLVDD